MSDKNTGYNPTAEQQQDMDNLSFDRKYRVNAIENLVENTSGDDIVRMQQPMKDTTATDGSQKTQIVETLPNDSTKLNPSLTISSTDMVEASTKTITKTISGISYEKIISYNAANEVISISSWSEV